MFDRFKKMDKAKFWLYLQALWLLARNPAAPLAPKLVALLTVTYALSPIDLIPDFIPVLGMLDDIVLIPLGVALAIRLTPAPIWEAALRQAEANPMRLAKTLWGLAIVIVIWALVLGVVSVWLFKKYA